MNFARRRTAQAGCEKSAEDSFKLNLYSGNLEIGKRRTLGRMAVEQCLEKWIDQCS